MTNTSSQIAKKTVNDFKFFDDEGNLFNLDWNESAELYEGVINMPVVSTDLYQTAQIFIVQKNNIEIDEYDDQGQPTGEKIRVDCYTYPEALERNHSNPKIVCKWIPDNEEETYMREMEGFSQHEIQLFHWRPTNVKNSHSSLIDDSASMPDLVKYDDGIAYDCNAFDEGNRNMILSINICFRSHEEMAFRRDLVIYYSYELNDELVVKPLVQFRVYAESIEEDERFKTICTDLGYKILDKDVDIFKDTDIKEQLPDNIYMNEKRKEIIMEGSNIYPYIGSYIGLCNAIKYFGYGIDDLYLREYWQNKDTGKILMTDPIMYSTQNGLINNLANIDLSTNRHWIKTHAFRMVYKINKVNLYEEDIDDLPTVTENFAYTIEDMLIKLYGLKDKLEKEFMPLNTYIKDIIGEADYFSKVLMTHSYHHNCINYIEVGMACDFDVYYHDISVEHTPVFLDDLYKDYNLVPDCDPENGVFLLGAPVVLRNNTLHMLRIDECDFCPDDYPDITIDDLNFDLLHSEVEWTIYKAETKESPEFTYHIRGPIYNAVTGQENNINYLRVILPYVGKYDVEMRIYDLHNNISTKFKPEYVNVLAKDLDIAGWYKKFDFNRNDQFSNEDIMIGETLFTSDDFDEANYVQWAGSTITTEELDYINELSNGLRTAGNGQNLKTSNNIINHEDQYAYNIHPDTRISIRRPRPVKTLIETDDSVYYIYDRYSRAGAYTCDNMTHYNTYGTTSTLAFSQMDDSGNSRAMFEFGAKIEGNAGNIRIIPVPWRIGDRLKIIDKNGNIGVYTFTSTSIEVMADKLNRSTDEVISKYEYEVVEYQNRPIMIHALAKHYGPEYDFKTVELGDNKITYWCNSINNNPTFNEIPNFLCESGIIPRLSQVWFSTSRSEILRMKTPIWKITSDNPDFSTIYYKGYRMPLLFKRPGNYKIEVSAQDCQNNKYFMNRQFIIKVI